MHLLGGLYALVTATSLGVAGAISDAVGGRDPWLRRAAGVALLGLAAWLLGTP